MKAGRITISTRQFAVVDVPIPEPGLGQVRIKVMAAGVCLSDVHLLDKTLTPGYLEGDVVTMGHEVAGIIDSLGAQVDGFKVGDKVIVFPAERDERGRIHTLGFDYDGGFAEFTVAHYSNLIRIPDTLPFEQACIIPDAVSTPWAAISSTGQIHNGETVAVFGVGGLGYHAVKLLKMLECIVIAIDPSHSARERALAAGADHAFDPNDVTMKDAIKKLTSYKGINAAFDFAGVSAVRHLALSLLGESGRLVIVGIANEPIVIPSDMTFTYKMLRIFGHYGSDKSHTEQIVEFVEKGQLDLSQSISQVLDLENAQQALDMLENKVGNPIRLVLRP